MYKIKTKKAIQKRFRITGGDKIMCLSSGLRHRLVSKASDRKRNGLGFHELHATDVKRMKKYIYNFASK